jgi:hypothetical protein
MISGTIVRDRRILRISRSLEVEVREKNESAAYKLQHFAANKNAIRQRRQK